MLVVERLGERETLDLGADRRARRRQREARVGLVDPAVGRAGGDARATALSRAPRRAHGVVVVVVVVMGPPMGLCEGAVRTAAIGGGQVVLQRRERKRRLIELAVPLPARDRADEQRGHLLDAVQADWRGHVGQRGDEEVARAVVAGKHRELQDHAPGECVALRAGEEAAVPAGGLGDDGGQRVDDGGNDRRDVAIATGVRRGGQHDVAPLVDVAHPVVVHRGHEPGAVAEVVLGRRCGSADQRPC